MDNKVVNIPLSIIRDLFDNKVYSKSDALLDILSMADENGEFYSTTRKLTERWNWSNTKVDLFLKKLDEKDILTSQKRHKNDTLFLVNTAFLGIAKDTKTSQKRHKNDAKNAHETIKTTDALRMILDAWNGLSVYGIEPISNCGISSSQKVNLISLAKMFSVNDILQTIEKIKSSDFLQGEIGYGWKITFDWFLIVKNYKKVRSGMYNDNNNRVNPIADDNDTIKEIISDVEQEEQKEDMFLQPIDSVDKFDEFWELYPKKFNYIGASMEYKYLLKTTPALSEDDLIVATRNYAESCQVLKTQEQYIKNPENWLKDSTWINYMSENYKKPKEQKKQNKFNQFQQNDYDFELLEKKLLDN